MIIEREAYLERLRNRMHTDSIKVITGIRRCGKSFLVFNLFYDYLRSIGIDESHILTYELDRIENIGLRDNTALYGEIKSRLVDDSQYYILIDEIQMIDGFHELLNSLLHVKNADVYVTGSNSRLLSKDIVTEFRGRSSEIQVRPLSFSEYCAAKSADPRDALDEYMDFGGMPELFQYNDAETKTRYLKSLVREVYLTDIVERNKVENMLELENLTDLLCSSVGSITNVKKATDTLRTENGSAITDKTVKSYIDHLCDAFLFEQSRRYDVKGRRHFSSLSKYYIADVGLKNARENFRQVERTHIMENIVYNELRYRGYDVDVGVVEFTETTECGRRKKSVEIDFVASLGSDRVYIQSSYSIEGEGKRAQEVRPFLKINDSFRKIVIVRESMPPRKDDDGIIYMGLIQFLLDRNSLRL